MSPLKTVAHSSFQGSFKRATFARSFLFSIKRLHPTIDKKNDMIGGLAFFQKESCRISQF